ncbi:MAG: hypothetical protein LBQ10_11995 [Desulfovibrio sp.]|jgi:hypothetical protein|nr:hypothetical protein [Desulfovibrio sp.]
MGGMGDFFASSGARMGMRGAVTGFQTGSGIANAQYNAAAARMQAESLERQSKVTAWLIRKQYESEYRQLLQNQERQQSWNRVLAAKRGITGDSADATMQSYAAKGQKNLETLYYNAAMRTGKTSLEYGAKSSALYEKARQYDWLATSTLVGGVVSLGAGFFDQAAKDAKGTELPYALNELGVTPDEVISNLKIRKGLSLE